MSWDREGVLAGRYRKLGRIGQGGMGAVWRALDTDLDREVAIKELRVPEQVTEQERAVWYSRMEREARAAARLRHPAIVTVYDRVMGEDGRPWIVMELIHGRSLEQMLAERGRLPAHQVAAIGLAMLDALSAAHAQGIVHRDVKPANVLLEGDRVVLTDFGIAAVEGDATLTRSGAVLGTPAYMSPEQVRGETVTPASDLWSLGATLYAAVEGRPPFTAPTHGALFIAIATREPPPPVCGGPLARLLDGLLHKDPAARLSATQARELLALASTDAERHPAAHSAPASRITSSPGPATRVDIVPQTARARPAAVRRALVCGWIAVVGSLLLPLGLGEDIALKVLLDEGPSWMLWVLVALFAVSALQWRFPHRAVPALAIVIALDLALFLAAPLGRVSVAQVFPHTDIIPVGYGLAFGWLAGAVALMLAFAGLNGALISRIQSPRARVAVSGAAVVLEGLVAVLWPVLVSWALTEPITLSPITYDFIEGWMFKTLLGLVWIAWSTAQLAPRLRRTAAESGA
ncbi:serine/threonine-protein kinase [Spirillospora sp. NPDC048832]